METFEDWLGPVVLVQVVTPPTPVIAHCPAALGATAPLGPVTVAVNVTVVPRAAVAALATTATVGSPLVTAVEAPEVGEVAR